MRKKIVDFTNLLRKSGVRVSVSESIDAFDALESLSIEDRDIFKDALCATMVKRGDDIPAFNQLFDLYWSSFYDSMKDAFDEATGETVGGFDPEELMEMMRGQGQQGGGSDLSELAKALLSQDFAALEKLIREAAQRAGVPNIENMLQIGFFTRRTTEQLDLMRRLFIGG